MKGLLDIDFDELTIDNLGSWPTPVKAIVLAVLFFVIVFLAYWFDTKKQLQMLHSVQNQEVELRAKYEVKQNQASNLEAYRQQLEEMQGSFGEMLRQLPSQTEVPGLLEDISKAGIASGLEFKLFAPQQEVHHDFYASLPIKIIVVGQYHELADFISRVANLSRIVTLHDFKISKAKEEGPSERTPKPFMLNMEITAKTYRYAENSSEGVDDVDA